MVHNCRVIFSDNVDTEFLNESPIGLGSTAAVKHGTYNDILVVEYTRIGFQALRTKTLAVNEGSV